VTYTLRLLASEIYASETCTSRLTVLDFHSTHPRLMHPRLTLREDEFETYTHESEIYTHPYAKHASETDTLYCKTRIAKHASQTNAHRLNTQTYAQGVSETHTHSLRKTRIRDLRIRDAHCDKTDTRLYARDSNLGTLISLASRKRLERRESRDSLFESRDSLFESRDSLLETLCERLEPRTHVSRDSSLSSCETRVPRPESLA